MVDCVPYYKDAMLGRFYAICNCCSCCCGAMEAQRNGTPLIASSGYVAQVDGDLCAGCGTCAGYCQFAAIAVEDGFAGIDGAACMGCGVCVAHCPQEAISLVRDVAKGEPLEIQGLIARAADEITYFGAKMGAIVDELLRFACVGEIDRDLLEPLDMASILAEVERRLAAVLDKHEAQVIRPPTWPAAVGYGPWVEEVWSNYVSNAIVHGGQARDGVPPRVELGAEPVPGPRHADKPMIRFWVRDNGPGLAPEEQARLFAEFQQLSNGNGNGHGLGLSIARRIVDRLGGEVGVESAPGQGSLFYFTLPAANGHRGAHVA